MQMFQFNYDYIYRHSSSSFNGVKSIDLKMDPISCVYTNHNQSDISNYCLSVTGSKKYHL